MEETRGTVAQTHEEDVSLTTTDLEVIAAIDNGMLRGIVLCGPTPGQFHARVLTKDLEKWRASYGTESHP